MLHVWDVSMHTHEMVQRWCVGLSVKEMGPCSQGWGCRMRSLTLVRRLWLCNTRASFCTMHPAANGMKVHGGLQGKSCNPMLRKAPWLWKWDFRGA